MNLLSLLLLYKNDFDVGKYISFEEQLNRGDGIITKPGVCPTMADMRTRTATLRLMRTLLPPFVQITDDTPGGGRWRRR